MKLSIKLYKIKRKDIKRAIYFEDWQKVRTSMKGTSLEEKIITCNDWLASNHNSTLSQIQVINYINALKRSLYSKDINNYLI